VVPFRVMRLKKIIRNSQQFKINAGILNFLRYQKGQRKKGLA
jgi:hypothetical protein